MARLIFPDEGSRLVYRTSGTALALMPGANALIYTTSAANVLADLRMHDGTDVVTEVGITGSVLTVDAYSRLPLFWGPDGVDTVWAVISGGPATPVYARFDDRIDAALAIVGPTGPQGPQGATGAAGAAGANASTPTRTTATYTTAALGAGGTETGTITLAKGYRLLRIQTSAEARVRVYSNAAARTADASRVVGVDPTAGVGVILDYLTTSGNGVSTATDLSPVADGANTEAVPSTAIPLSVTATAAGAITVTLTYVVTET